jgi:hypothetical protein
MNTKHLRVPCLACVFRSKSARDSDVKPATLPG